LEFTPEKEKSKEVKRRVETPSPRSAFSNPTRKALMADLYLAAFDKEKRLISAGTLGWGNSDMAPALKPGEKRDGMGLVLEATSEELDRVASAQGRLYVKE
jgi:hypothetical protein